MTTLEGGSICYNIEHMLDTHGDPHYKYFLRLQAIKCITHQSTVFKGQTLIWDPGINYFDLFCLRHWMIFRLFQCLLCC